MTLTARLRRFWLDVHLWIGVGLLVALVPLSVTGSILVWHDQLDRTLYSHRYAITGPMVSMPIEAYAEAAQSAFGDRAQLTQVRLPQKAGDPVVAVGRMPGKPEANGRPRSLNAWMDPSTARVLDTSEVAKGFSMVLHRVHGTLLIPEVGRKVVGWLGWAMFISSATGLWLWWPRNGGFLRGLRWRRGASTLFNLHHMLGFWVCIPLAVLSLTGVYISFPQTSRAVFGLPAPPPRATGPDRFAPPVQPKLALNQAVAAAQVSVKGQVVEVTLPTKVKDPVWRVGIKPPGVERPTIVQVVDATGQVKPGRERAGDRSARDEISPLMRKIHDGAGMGPVWQSIIFLGGIAPAVLSVSGLIIWLRRRARRQGALVD